MALGGSDTKISANFNKLFTKWRNWVRILILLHILATTYGDDQPAAVGRWYEDQDGSTAAQV